MTTSFEPITPLMPFGIEESIKNKCVKKIPANKYGTVYLCPLPLSLFKTLARSNGKILTVNDVLATCISNTVRQYLRSVGFVGNESIRFFTPLAVPKSPYKFLDEQRGINNHFLPVHHKVPLYDLDSNAQSSFRQTLFKMHDSFQLIKRSHIASMLLKLPKFRALFPTPNSMIDYMRRFIGKETFGWSNIPGPSIPIFIQGKKVTELQCLVSNGLCFMQTCSYNGMVYTSIQVDTRTTMDSHRLSYEFNRTVEGAIRELLNGLERDNALDVLRASTKNHTNPGPYLTPCSCCPGAPGSRYHY